VRSVASAEILPLHLVRVGAPGCWARTARRDMVDVELDLPDRIIIYHVDLDLGARLHSQECEIVRRASARGDNPAACPERKFAQRRHASLSLYQ
jgi:hypothetical protein